MGGGAGAHRGQQKHQQQQQQQQRPSQQTQKQPRTRARGRRRRSRRRIWAALCGDRDRRQFRAGAARDNADSLRHPASLTKIMTLYLLFEQLEAGKLKLDTPLPSLRARRGSRRRPSSGSSPARRITVEDAIQALVTKSANDAAVVIAEAIGGDEDTFAKLMTRKARALGMSRTVYRNASGLPDDEQVTTARDQALLGRAIQDRFPHYYQLFLDAAASSIAASASATTTTCSATSTASTASRPATPIVRLQSRVLGAPRRQEHRRGRARRPFHSGARDARMRQLIEECIPQAATERTAPPIMEQPVEGQPEKVDAAVRRSRPRPQLLCPFRTIFRVTVAVTAAPRMSPPSPTAIDAASSPLGGTSVKPHDSGDSTRSVRRVKDAPR